MDEKEVAGGLTEGAVIDEVLETLYGKGDDLRRGNKFLFGVTQKGNLFLNILTAGEGCKTAI